MTCVPDSILRKFKSVLFMKVNVNNRNDLEKYIIQNCTRVKLTNVQVNGIRVSTQQEKECQEALKNFKVNNDGQYVSTFYPLFIFLTAVSGCSIKHVWYIDTYGNTSRTSSVKTFYTTCDTQINSTQMPIIEFTSNNRHMH